MCLQITRLARALKLASLCILVVLPAEAAYCTVRGSALAQTARIGIDKINHVIWIIQHPKYVPARMLHLSAPQCPRIRSSSAPDNTAENLRPAAAASPGYR
jgi:hypothetical protein